jgi:hypothetical protein
MQRCEKKPAETAACWLHADVHISLVHPAYKPLPFIELPLSHASHSFARGGMTSLS